MFIFYFFLFHIAIWVLYILYVVFLHPFPFNPKSKIRKFRGNLEKDIQHFLDSYNIMGMTIVHAKNDFAHYNIKDKSIHYYKLSKKRYTAQDLYTALHECGHALQDKESFWAIRLRAFINQKVKVFTSAILIELLFFAPLLSMTLDWNGLWSFLIFFIVLHYLYCLLVVIPCEIDAHLKAYRYLIENYPIPPNEKIMFKRSTMRSLVDYIISIPALIILP